MTNHLSDSSEQPPDHNQKVTTAEARPPANWIEAQRALASANNLALVTIGADNDYQTNVANETSICQHYLNDPQKSQMCASFCGRARQWALAENVTILFRCEANLHCFAAPIKGSGTATPQVLLGGRTFLTASEYRQFLQQAKAANQPLEPKLFSNIKFTDNQEFQRASQRIVQAAAAAFQPLPPQATAPQQRTNPIATPPALPPASLSAEQLKTFFSGSFEQNCRAVMQLIGTRFAMRSAVFLMRNGKQFTACAAGGELRDLLIGFTLQTNSSMLEQLQQCEDHNDSFPLQATALAELQTVAPCEQATAFPFFIGGELSGALITIDTTFDDTTRQELARLGQSIIIPLELAKLRGELQDQNKSLAQWQDFAHLLATRTNAPETYSAIVEKVVSTLGAERVSLLIYNDEAKKLVCKAASGLPAQVASGPKIGEGISGLVLERGEPLLVRDWHEQSWLAGRVHGGALSNSFISFPLLGGGKRLGVINLTDRANGQTFTVSDLEWLGLFAPYAAAALERIDLHEKAQRFQLMAITDPLTGLLNRRYLEERFAQEIERSKRYQFPLSFIMMDIDSFKSFNDTFGHQSGDEILRETAQCIRKSLRNFDVAARYGGEEFIVVLPETDVTSATILAERLRKAVEQHFAGDPRRPVTVSIGVSSLSKTLQNRQQVIRAADQALYAAKKRGKNCVVVYNTQLVPGLA